MPIVQASLSWQLEKVLFIVIFPVDQNTMNWPRQMDQHDDKVSIMDTQIFHLMLTWTIEQSVTLPVIWDVMAPMWHDCDGARLQYLLK